MGKSSDDAFNDSLWCMTRYWPLEGISASLHYPRLHNVTKTQSQSWLHVWPVWSWKQWWVSGQEQIVFISGWGFELSVRGACSPHVWCDLVLDFSHASCCTHVTLWHRSLPRKMWRILCVSYHDNWAETHLSPALIRPRAVKAKMMTTVSYI